MIIDFATAKNAQKPTPELKEGSVFSTQGWLIIEQSLSDTEGNTLYHLRQPKISLDGFETYEHPKERARESITENDLRYDVKLEDHYYKVIILSDEQLVAIECNINGVETGAPNYLTFNPELILETPTKIISAKVEPTAYDFVI